jgi:predicted RNA-binding Zn-ribbon protein involved in translation (DUF1610 family)
MGAERRGLPQAGQLFLRAGHARIENNEMNNGLGLIKQGINLFANSNQIQRLNMIRPRLIAELQAKGFEREAAELDTMIHEMLDRHKVSGVGQRAQPQKRFPPKCSSCGGNLRPDEIEWIDSVNVACPYCGSVVQAE